MINVNIIIINACNSMSHGSYSPALLTLIPIINHSLLFFTFCNIQFFNVKMYTCWHYTKKVLYFLMLIILGDEAITMHVVLHCVQHFFQWYAHGFGLHW